MITIRKQWQILFALPFLLPACDKLLPPAGNGELVQVKIRAVSIAGGAQNETITRSVGEKRIVGEPIIQNLGGGMLAEITVEEDLSALRAGNTPLADGAKFRVIVLDEGDNYIAHENFTAGSVPEEIALQEGDYSFICFSFNTSTTLPDAGSGGESGFTFEASTSNEIYWQRQSVTIPLTTDVSFLLKPQFVKAKLALDAGTGRTITSVAAGSISLDAASSGNFSLKTGGFNAGTEGVAFTGWATIGERTVTSGEITFLPKATNYIISWLADAVTVTDGATSESSAAGRATILNSKLAAGGSYRIRLKPLRFAGSNIYWEGGDDGKLTFDLHGDDIHAKYQGVYFQWGSLIGVSPVGEDYESSATVLYKPKGATMPRAWEPPATGSALSPVWNSWTDIPSYYNVDVSPAGIDAHTLLYNPDFDNYRGDICNYINSSYRMPTLAELTALSSAYVGFYHDSDNVPVSSDDENVAGRYVFTDNYGTLSGYALPASGCRSSNSGTLYDVGYSGSYWSGSAYGSSSGAYRLYFSGSGISTDSYARYYGRSVRCVMIE